MNPISEFSFLCRDGLHYYWYNSNAQISVFKVICKRSKKVLYQEESFCLCEAYHIRRIQQDFNANCVDTPSEYKYLIKQKTKTLYFDLLCSFLFLILFSLSSLVWFVVRIIEVFYAIKKRKFTPQTRTTSTNSSL